jgi:CheY-like chemotaxis protein
MPTILVVDDDDAVRAVTAMSVEGSGYNVIEAADTVAAMHQLKAHPDIEPLHRRSREAVARTGRCGLFTEALESFHFVFLYLHQKPW